MTSPKTDDDSDGTLAAMFCGYSTCAVCGHTVQVFLVKRAEDAPSRIEYLCRHCNKKEGKPCTLK